MAAAPSQRDEARSSSGSSTSSSVSEEAEWLDADQDGDDDDDQEALAVISLVDDRVFPDATSMLAYCRDEHGLDFVGVRDRLALDFHGTVKLINFIRQRVHEGIAVSGADITAADLDDDGYLKPVLDDDALILCLDDLPEPAGTAAAADAPHGDGVDGLLQKNAELQAQLEQLAKQFSSYRLAVQQTLDQRWEDAPAGTESKGKEAAKPAGEDAGVVAKDESEYYFESYAHNDIHEVMLKDAVRTDAYRDFIYQNKHLFAGKVVLDIGCGTGILSMFCARAGAKQVIAVDKSEIIDKARENIYSNGLGNVITTLKGRIEEVVLPVASVDIIVSEWMGYCLLYEAMLPSVIWARDRYLAADGLLVPSHASIWMAPVADASYVADNISFWRDVYGFDMAPMQRGIFADARPDVLPAAAVCDASDTARRAFRVLDLHTTTVADLVFAAPWHTTLNAATAPADVDGFLVWFDMFFAQSRHVPPDMIGPATTALDWVADPAKRDAGLVAFTTGPFGAPTHWRQGLLLLDDRNKKKLAKVDAAQKHIGGVIEYVTPDGHARGVNIKVSFGPDGKDDKQDQTWLLH
ncbi:S-adenosyl-L-methionine-dependent methyltransferase [Lasiosphaeria miniovina]|uniref:type I protein arginine methyltransferase n=1 Tax=Lasiosphaeria miniovina TaxID=1954250 RepID=A0AA40DKL1_9PEZI|nr:S-adenosyl-L-methionine-dependent methyltransferase [Lasiosphaeria miniovina]KAK0706655.1 S-adenosyl-L-methionine-dependent methyltransferase [Lasiosphaeria miniovina]